MSDLDGTGEALIWNEFAEIRITLDFKGITPRLFLENLETGASTYLDPLELATIIDTPDELKFRWLNIGAYSNNN
ncbi:hypothetical protein [Arthrobacter sp. AZCC_0090]|uniref:hypothetical protein n=1 Tax=Arthrobacter sp. AZCC_0090 TaxID=2735881 RepID=UPI00161725B3|nr:hypothetical protein [Arthrobacter sp. AZCC_0090]MBB6406334.1 hypothetical protein [Arthrobacter sp. AZCC_0090]